MKKNFTMPRLVKELLGEEKYSTSVHHVFFLCCLTVIVSATVYVGAVPTRIFGHDIFFLLDNGWRIVNGQSTHVDFTSAWGPVTFLIVGLGLLLSDYTVDGVGYGSAVFGLVIGIWSYCLSQGRLIPMLQVLLSLYLVGLVVSPYPFGNNVFLSGHAMVYNRYGYVLLALIMVGVFPVQGVRPGKGVEFIKCVSSGIALAVTFYLKASYFAAAVILLGSTFLFKGFNLSRFSGLTLGFLTASIIILSFIRFDLVALLTDLNMAAGARVHGVFYDDLLYRITLNLPIFAFVILLSVQVIKKETSMTEYPVYSVLFFGIVVLFVDTLMLISNNQNTNFPLSAVFSLLLVNRAILQNQRQKSIGADLTSSSIVHRSIIYSGLAFFLYFFAMEIAGLGYGVIQKAQVSKPHATVEFLEPRLASLKLFDNETEPRSNGSLYTEFINDGIHLLRNNSETHETILTIDMFNPFSYALGREPAKGGIAAAAFNYTLNENHHPSNDKYFGTANLVMVPKQSASPGIFYDGFYKIYESGLMQRFNLVAESDLWLLYRRK